MRFYLKIILSIVLGLSILSSFFLQNQKVSAATDHLVINEVYYDAVEEPDEEWMEIYNPTDTAVNLTGFKIGDEETKGGHEGMYNFPVGSIIETKSYLVVANKAASFFSLYGRKADFELPKEDPTIPTLVKYSVWATGSMSLSNTGDEVLLLDGFDQVVDAVVYGNGIYPDIIPGPRVAKSHSFERQPKGKDTDDCAKDFIEQQFPSPFAGILGDINLDINDVGEDFVGLNWGKNFEENFKDFILYQSTDDKTWSEFLISEQKETNFKVSSLESGKKYYFKIRVFDYKNDFWDSNIVSTTTKKEYSQAVIVNELFPAPHEPFLSPETDDEYIELYNSSDEAIDLSGWQIEDTKGTTKTYTIQPGTKIKPKSYLPFYQKEAKERIETGIILNNDGDSVNLLWPDGGLCSQSEVYTDVTNKNNISWSRNSENKWVFSTTATPGWENKITTKEEKNNNPAFDQDLPIISINDAKNQPKNSYVKVSGIVTVTPGLFGKKVMYIQDESGGIKIYFDDALWPELKIGDQVIIIGKISTSSGEYQIKVYNAGDITIIGGLSPPAPIKLKINQLADLVGSLIKISGRVTKISGSSVWLDDGTGEIRFYFYAATGIKGLGLDEGDWVEIVGILSKTSAGLRLLPRSMDDLKIKKQMTEETTTQQESIVDKVLGIQKAKAAPADYRSIQESASVQKKYSYLWGILISGLGLILLASLTIIVKIQKK